MVRDSRNYSGANNATVLTILCTQYTGSTQEYVFSSPLREQAMCDCEALRRSNVAPLSRTRFDDPRGSARPERVNIRISRGCGNKSGAPGAGDKENRALAATIMRLQRLRGSALRNADVRNPPPNPHEPPLEVISRSSRGHNV